MSRRRLSWIPVLVFVAASAMGPGPSEKRGRVLATVTRDGAGSITQMAIEAPWSVSLEVAPTGTGAVVRRFGKRLYTVNSGSGTVDIRTADSYELLHTVDLGPGAQPMDVAPINSHFVYVSDFNRAHLHRLDVRSGAVTVGPDLSIYADSDGLPEAAMMERIGSEIFVQVQRFDRSTGAENGAFLAVVPVFSPGPTADTNARAPWGQRLPGIALQGIRPSFKMQVDLEHKRLFVCTPGLRLDHDPAIAPTGIEEIDLSTKQSLGFFVTEANIGGDIGPFVMVRPDKGFVSWHTSIVLSTHISPFKRNRSLGEIRMSGDGWVDAIAYDAVSDQVFYAEPDTSASSRGSNDTGDTGDNGDNGDGGAVWIFDARTNQQLGGVSVGGTVNDLEVVRL